MMISAKTGAKGFFMNNLTKPRALWGPFHGQYKSGRSLT
jgi:hypothetical protein